jgi:hypothetical protein
MRNIPSDQRTGNAPVDDEFLSIIAEGVARLHDLYGSKPPPEARQAVIHLVRAVAALRRITA